MTLLHGARIGAQRPRWCNQPEGVSSSGREAVELAASTGLILDDWQSWVLDGALRERADGRWAAFEVALLVGRQNGKNGVLQALELAALFLFGDRLVIHSAHQFATAQEHFGEMQARIESSDDLRRKVAKVYTANGKESIILRSGARLKFVARARGAARGFSADRIVFDEAYDLPAETLGAMIPTLSARPNPQIWYTSSAPQSWSTALHAIRRRAASESPGRLWFAEWGCEPGADPTDHDNWRTANPALGIRIPYERLETELDSLDAANFARERLGIPDPEDQGHNVFGPGKWQACADPDRSISGCPAIALEVSPDMAWASFGAAGRRDDGLIGIDLVDRRPGTSWTVDAARALQQKWKTPIWFDPRSPTAGVVPDLEAAHVDVRPLPGAELSKACAALQHAVIEGHVRHPGVRPLDDAVAGAAVRQSGDSWVWARARSDLDITALTAVTIALWSFMQAPPPQASYFSLTEV